MSLANPADFQFPLEEQFEGRLFTRRTDLSNDIRLLIGTNALHAILNRVWGTITHLADEYGISRTFIYSLANNLKKVGQFLFEEATATSSASLHREHAIESMLSFRLEGCSSIGAISTMMNRFDCELSSTGSISQTLSQVGGLLPMTVSTETGIIQYLVFASDEIFSKMVPILITVDPCSSAILRMELADSRNADDWKNHFECLKCHGIDAIYLVSDDGTGIRAGHAEAMGDVVRQSDTYHAIAHRLGSWGGRLETAAYAAIEKEYDEKRKLKSAKSKDVQEKRQADYTHAIELAEKAITLYDDFSYLYRCVISELNVFDNDGKLRSRQQAEAGVTCGLALIEDLNHTHIAKAVNKVRRALLDLFHYFDIAKKVVNECKGLGIDEERLKAYCVAWQWGKAARKAKKSGRKKRAQEQEQFCLDIAEGLQQQETEDEDAVIQQEIYSRLDKIVQSSALVECINSIIRPYLNTSKNQVNQKQLNLIMHYHNHRRYRDGVRKGKTPMEILTGKEQTKDWIAILFEIIREKKPELLLAS
jgi:hypothetical protein